MEDREYHKIKIGPPAELIEQIKAMGIAAKHEPALERMFKEIFQEFSKIYDECIQAGIDPTVTKNEFIEAAAMTYCRDACFKAPLQD